MRKIADSSDPDRMAIYSILHEAADCIAYLHKTLIYIKDDVDINFETLKEKFGDL